MGSVCTYTACGGIFSQRYKVDNICTAHCGVCFTEVQSGPCLYCLLWHFFTEIQGGQCLYCLFWYLFHRGTKGVLPVVIFVSQRYKVDSVYTACCGICFTEVQSGQYLYCLL